MTKDKEKHLAKDVKKTIEYFNLRERYSNVKAMCHCIYISIRGDYCETITIEEIEEIVQNV